MQGYFYRLLTMLDDVRTSNVYIGGADHTPTDALQVPVAMRRLMTWFTKQQQMLHPIELAALFHHKLVNIHPFFDGNGRTARLVKNVMLMRSGYPLTVILKNDRQKYYRALQAADKGNLTPLVKFVAQAVERSLDMCLDTLTPASPKNEKYQLLSEVSASTPYSTKYLNLLARQGKLEAHKKGRNWVTTEEALQRYIRGRERQRGLK